MQAVAVGASVAYPLLRLARAIPLPVLMVGAGLFFAGSKTGQSVTQKASDLASDLSDEVRRRSHDLSDQVGASITAAKDMAAGAVGQANEAIAGGADQLRHSTASATDELGTRTDSLRANANVAQDALISRTRDLRDDVAGVVAAATDGAQNLATGASAAVRSAAASTRDAAKAAPTAGAATVQEIIPYPSKPHPLSSIRCGVGQSLPLLTQMRHREERPALDWSGRRQRWPKRHSHGERSRGQCRSRASQSEYEEAMLG